ncbi:hypothetical protein BHM03_00035355 [Ensete ventricosum]|nr:hypothetical protein BHM03_00035355 [Ensete ventricosum]
MKALDTSLPDPSSSSSSTALALPYRTTPFLVATAARPISTSRGSSSWPTPSLFLLSHDSISENDLGVPSLLSGDRCSSFSVPVASSGCYNNRCSATPLAPSAVHLSCKGGPCCCSRTTDACSPATAQPHEGRRLCRRRCLLAIHSTAPVAVSQIDRILLFLAVFSTHPSLASALAFAAKTAKPSDSTSICPYSLSSCSSYWKGEWQPQVHVCFIILDIGRVGSAAQDCSLQHLLLLLGFSRPPSADNLRACALVSVREEGAKKR